MSGYTKLFNSILASTIWQEKDQTRLVWITMLAMADKRGIVEASLPGLADIAKVPLEGCLEAIRALSAPDAWSRSKEHAGRRIEPVEGGWRLLNHAKYRAKLGADERREYLRRKQQEYRRRKQPLSTNVSDVSDMSTNVNNVSDTYTMSDKNIQCTHIASPSPDPDPKERKRKSARISSVSFDPEKDSEDVGERAAWFVGRYAELYPVHRNGARYYARPSVDFEKAKDLCAVWPSDRLEKIAEVFLTCDNRFAESGSRTIGQFAALASWCDDQLKAWEREHGVTVA